MDIAKLVTFGRGGDTVHLGKNHTITGYGSPENPHAATPSDERLFPDGTPVIDKRQAIETPEGLRWVFEGPMVNVDLPDDEVDMCPEPSPFFAGAVAENQFGTLLAIHHATKRDGKAGALDSVSIREYIQGWCEHGARIGEYRNGAIVWLD